MHRIVTLPLSHARAHGRCVTSVQSGSPKQGDHLAGLSHQPPDLIASVTKIWQVGGWPVSTELPF